MRKIGQFVYKDYDIILWEEAGRPVYEYGAIVRDENDHEWETSTSTSLAEIIQRAITYIENAQYAPRMGM